MHPDSESLSPDKTDAVRLSSWLLLLPRPKMACVRSARSSLGILGNSLNNSPILRSARFLISRALSSASVFRACCAYTSNARALSRSSLTSSTRWHSAMALHIASYRTSAGGCVFAGMAFWFPLMLRSAAEVLAIDFIRSPAIFTSCRRCARRRISVRCRIPMPLSHGSSSPLSRCSRPGRLSSCLYNPSVPECGRAFCRRTRCSHLSVIRISCSCFAPFWWCGEGHPVGDFALQQGAGGRDPAVFKQRGTPDKLGFKGFRVWVIHIDGHHDFTF